MGRRFVLTAFAILLLFLATSCMVENEPAVDGVPPEPGTPAPLFHVDGRIYGLYGRWGGASNFLDDTYAYIGTIPSHTHLFQNVTDNFQSNDPYLVGARLYQSEGNIILVIDGVYSLHRFIGEIVNCWSNND